MASQSSRAARRYLIIGPAWVGDMIMAQSLFIYLKQQSPEAVIDVVAPMATAPLLAFMPEVNRAIVLSVKHGEFALGARKKLGLALRAAHYDQAILLTNSFKSALVPWFARVPCRTGWRGEWRLGLVNDVRPLDEQAMPRMVERFVNLGAKKNAAIMTDVPWPRLRVSSSVEMSQRLGLLSTSRLLALCPGAEYGPAKRWPAEHYAVVAREMSEKGWTVCLLGGPKDQMIAAEVQAACENKAIDLTGKTTLAEALQCLSLATAVVTNDSGLMHVAAALDKPIVAIYGSSSPTFTPPLSHHARILSLHLSCSPCFKRECPLQHLHCLTQLHPRLVLAALEDLVELATQSPEAR